MLSPIALRVRAAGGGVPATLSVAPSTAGYSAKSATPYVPPEPQTYDRKGIFEKTPKEGMVTTTTAKFMWEETTPIAGLESMVGTCLVENVTWTIARIRARYYFGKLNGYSADLVKG